MTNDEFCQIHNQYYGETIDNPSQLKITFTGPELRLFLEFAINRMPQQDTQEEGITLEYLKGEIERLKEFTGIDMLS